MGRGLTALTDLRDCRGADSVPERQHSLRAVAAGGVPLSPLDQRGGHLLLLLALHALRQLLPALVHRGQEEETGPEDVVVRVAGVVCTRLERNANGC